MLNKKGRKLRKLNSRGSLKKPIRKGLPRKRRDWPKKPNSESRRRS